MSERYVRRYVRKNVERYVRQMSEDMSERMSKDMSERCQKECQKICQKEFHKRYVRKICQKICQQECQKICQKECQKDIFISNSFNLKNTVFPFKSWMVWTLLLGDESNKKNACESDSAVSVSPWNLEVHRERGKSLSNLRHYEEKLAPSNLSVPSSCIMPHTQLQAVSCRELVGATFRSDRLYCQLPR